MEAPTVQELGGGRLHLQHGPIGVVLRAWAAPPARRRTLDAAVPRSRTVLGERAGELAELRRPAQDGPRLDGAVARRMLAAVTPFAEVFVTPMAAVAGAVADELLAAMLAAAPLDRAFVNDGGDIALHVAPGETLTLAIAGDFKTGPVPALNAAFGVTADQGIGGVATSGRHGRSLSLGIADSVTVLARTAAAADAAATLIANAVDLDSQAVVRRPADTLDPDSDLGARLVTVSVGALTAAEVATALDRGVARAEGYLGRGLILGAALMLAGEARAAGGVPGLLPAPARKPFPGA